MSIPKEPRQLMINLMYLVLTALLALNVSAEVMNAFFSLDKGIKESGKIVDTSNTRLLKAIQKQAKAYPSEENKDFQSRAEAVQQLTTDFVQYVEDLREELFNAAGGPNPDHPEWPKRKKDKDVTTRLLVLGSPETPEDDGKGFELEQRIKETRQKLIELVDSDPNVVKSISLDIEDWKKLSKDKKSWADFKFRQMPVAAVFPMLSKIQSDAKASAATALNYLFEKVKGEDIVFDLFEPVVSAKKSYVIKGEDFEADIFLGAYSSQTDDNTKVYVNGQQLKMEDGKASYKARASSLGTKKLDVKITVTNPLNNETKEYTSTYEYEVGERSVAVSADKMNVFYIGVDNPISVSAAGIPTSKLKVSVSGGGGTIKKINNTQYIVKVKQPGGQEPNCFVKVSGAGMNAKKGFRVKRIPDPVARLGNKEDGTLAAGTFKAQKGLIAWLDNFDFDAKCQIQGFRLVRVPKRADAIEVLNSGGGYKSRAQSLVKQAKPGDTYYFMDVKARCPGDTSGRKINSLVFKIK